VPAHPETVGVILAGGLSRRMGGGDKPMRTIGGRAILARAIACIEPQCDQLVLNANGDPARFAAFGLPVIADTVEGFAGPLAGALAALEWTAANRPGVEWVLSAAGDCPFLPTDLAARLHAVRIEQGAQIAVASSGEQMHPVIALWNVNLRGDMREALVVENMRRVSQWMQRYRLATAEWSDQPVDPFFNANTPEDVARAEIMARRLGE